jgi:phosphatidylinositol alpha-1,6-mannosyltransferase
MTGETVLSRQGRPAGPRQRSAHAGNVLLLAPSRGLGGGIERYVQTIQLAFDDAGVPSSRLDLTRPGPAGHRALLDAAAAVLADAAGPTRVIIGHRALLPLAALLARNRAVDGISVICHGSEVWGHRVGPRHCLDGWLMRRRDVRLVAVSSFTAGTLLPRRPATVLPPGLSRAWFGELAGAADRAAVMERTQRAFEVMTAFRLAEWRDKGLPELTAALTALGRPDIRLSVCGSGEPSPDLLAYVHRFPWCTLRPGLTDAELATRFAQAKLFVLATRTRVGKRPCGEGFGLVLLEAQVAGTAVVGPAHGGSPAAYLEGVSGATPRDEGVTALTQVLDELTRQPARLTVMGRQGALWARARFAPERYAALAVDRLL